MSDRDEFFHVMGANGVPFKVALDLLRYATTVQRLAEVECNRELTLRERARDNTAVMCLMELATAHGFEVRVDGDPRGYCVKLKLPGGQHNDFGGEGLWCVPAKGYTAKQLQRLGA